MQSVCEARVVRSTVSELRDGVGGCGVGRFIFSKVVRILLYSSLSVALKGK